MRRTTTQTEVVMMGDSASNYPERYYRDFTTGYRRMVKYWNMTGTGASVESAYDKAKRNLGVENATSGMSEAHHLGQIVALLHLNGVEI